MGSAESSPLEMSGEPSPERKSRQVDPTLHGGETEAQDVGHLRVRKPLDVVEHQGSAIVW